MEQEQEWTKEAWATHIERVVRRGREIADLMHGRSYLSSEELSIIHSERIPIEEKRARVAAIRQARSEKMARRRAGKSVGRKPSAIVLSFDDRINPSDEIRMRALGIRLD
jgi:hypothetical protein